MTTKIHTAVDGNGRPLAVMITGGQRNDQVMLESVLDEIVVPRHRGHPRSRPDAVIADRLRRGRRGGRPPAFDETRYKQRNLIDRSSALLKQWRGLATRYDKLAIVYRAAVVLSACITWTPHKGDTT